MKKRYLKRADIYVSEIGFGCMSLGDTHVSNARLIGQAIDGGVNYFDTADLYQKGFNEETLGRALKGKRDQVIIASKVGNELNPNGEGWRWNPSKNYILKAIDKSLKRLQVEQIDLYQLHGGTVQDPIDEIIEAFEILKDVGKIKAYGLSSIRPNVINEYIKKSNFVTDMLQYSLLDRRAEEEVLPKLKGVGVGVMVRGSLAKGLLANKRISNYLNWNIQHIDNMRDKLISFSNEKITSSQLSIQWVLNNESVSTVVVGFRNTAQLVDTLKVNSVPKMSADIYHELSDLLGQNFYTEHRV